MQSTSSLYSLSSCSSILLVRHFIQDCHVQKVTVHAGVLLSDATALSSPRLPDVVLGERVLRMLISFPECHIIPLTRSVCMFGTIEDTPIIIRTGCKYPYDRIDSIINISSSWCVVVVLLFNKYRALYVSAFSWWLGLAKKEMLTPVGHLVSPVLYRDA